PFIVPDLPRGDHLLTAVAADFTLTCSPEGMFEILPASQTGGADGNTGPWSLLRTGVFAALLAAGAVGLLVLGRALVGGSFRRQRRDGRSPASAGHGSSGRSTAKSSAK